MGCSWISVICLVVLILASILANMKANTVASAPITTIKHDDTTKDTTEIPNKSSRPSSNNVVVTESGDSPDNCSITSTNQFNNNESAQNSSETHKCLPIITTPVPLEANTSSNGSGHTNVVLKRTYRDYPEYKHYKRLGDYVAYITTVPGFITNPLTIFVAMKIKPRYTCELYMIVLGFADLLTVTAKFIYRMIDEYFDKRYNWDCKLLSFTSSVGQVYSNLILMSWTLERFIAVMFPMKLAVWCSIRNTKITLGLLFVFSMAFSVPYITELEVMKIWTGQTFINVCEASEFMPLVWAHIDSVCYIYIPVTVVALCNLMILCRLNSMTKARISMASNKEIIDKKAQENKRMTILLLSISATFLLLHIPYICAMVLDYLYPDPVVLLLEDPQTFAKVLLYANLGYVLSEYQNCVNFFLYCLSGSKFRRTFQKLFCKCITARQTGTRQSSRTDTTKI